MLRLKRPFFFSPFTGLSFLGFASDFGTGFVSAVVSDFPSLFGSGLATGFSDEVFVGELTSFFADPFEEVASDFAAAAEEAFVDIASHIQATFSWTFNRAT